MGDVSIVISTESQSLIVEHQYTIEDYVTLNIKVKSGEFAGQSNFCVSMERIEDITQSLEGMYTKFVGRCEIADYDSDAHLTIEVSRLGQAVVSGQIGGSHEEHNMRFKFISDQTMIGRLINLLSTLKK